MGKEDKYLRRSSQALKGEENGNMKLRSWIGSLCVSVGLVSAPAYAQESGALYKTYCAICHDAGANSQAPNRDLLSRMSPEQILQALEKGAMKNCQMYLNALRDLWNNWR